MANRSELFAKIQPLYVAILVDHEEKPENCVTMLGYGSKAECDQLVLESKRNDLKFAQEVQPIATAIEELIGSELYMEANIVEVIDNLTDSQVEAIWEGFNEGSVSHHVMKPE